MSLGMSVETTDFMDRTERIRMRAINSLQQFVKIVAAPPEASPHQDARAGGARRPAPPNSIALLPVAADYRNIPARCTTRNKNWLSGLNASQRMARNL